MSRFEVLKFIAEVLRKIPKPVRIGEKKRPILAEKVVKISSPRSAEICIPI